MLLECKFCVTFNKLKFGFACNYNTMVGVPLLMQRILYFINIFENFKDERNWSLGGIQIPFLEVHAAHTRIYVAFRSNGG